MGNEMQIVAATVLMALTIVSAAGLIGWFGWLAFKQRELDMVQTNGEPGMGEGMARIEIAALKERIRKLEAIASGVEL